MVVQFKVPLPEKHGYLQKRGKNLGKWKTRYFKACWETDHGVLYYSDDAEMSGARKLSLAKCTAKKCPKQDKSEANLFCLELEFRDRGVTKRLYASSDIERDEWIDIIRKFAVQSSIENAYSFSRTEDAKLGEGTFANVYKGVDRITGKEWALKEVLKKKMKGEEMENLKIDFKIGFMVGSHPNVVYVKELVENSDRFYFVLEYLNGGELFDRILKAEEGHFTEKDAADLMRQATGAVAYLHSKGVAHRDLCPENFLMSTPAPDAQVKVAGFCFASVATGPTSLKGFCGSPGYMAPEVISSKGGYGLMADIWSMGVILYILLTGIPPFAAATDEECFQLTVRGSYDRVPLEGVSSGARDLVAKMLTYRPAKRITAAQALAHPWLSGGATADTALSATKNLRSWRARMRLKKAMIAILAIVKLSAIGRDFAAMRKSAASH